jgi:uncharacterized protein YigE (DUF2233 family)
MNIKRFGSRIVIAGSLLLAACNQQPAGEPVMRTEIGSGTVEEIGPAPSPQPNDSSKAEKLAANSACKPVTFEGAAMTHCTADPTQHRIETIYKDKDGTAFRSLRNYADAIGAESKNVVFAMNGGMFDKSGEPLGYYVEKSKRLVELNRGDGTGNFHMKPNGVFYGSGGTWRATSTEWFFKTVRDRPQFGTQSGPMLVTGSNLHPEIAENGPSRAIRNGVGVDAAGKAHFVISEEPVSFGKLARYFKDEIKVQNALYLDGTVSSLWDPAADRLDVGAPIGPIIVVTKR